MSLGDFGDQAMRSQQPQLSSHRCHLPTLLSSVFGGVVEMSADIAIAKTVKRKLAPIDDGQKLSVGLPQRIERAIASALAPHRSAHGRRLLCQRQC